MAYNRLTLYPDLSPHLALQIYKVFIRYKLEFDCTVWGFRIHNNTQHLKLTESPQRGVLSLILKAMKSIPTDGLESKRSMLPIDLHLEELQQHEVVKLVIKEDDYIQSSMKGRNKAHKIGSPFENLRSFTKQILQFLYQTKKCNVNQLLFPKETEATLELFHLPNLLLILPETKLQLSALLDGISNMQHYISSILDTCTNKTMIFFTDGSAQSNPGLTGSGVIIKKYRNSTPIKIAKAVKYMGSSFEGESKAIKIAAEYARDNISPSNDSLHIFSNCLSAILAVVSQNRENYHNSTIRAIRENLVDISPNVQASD